MTLNIKGELVLVGDRILCIGNPQAKHRNVSVSADNFGALHPTVASRRLPVTSIVFADVRFRDSKLCATWKKK